MIYVILGLLILLASLILAVGLLLALTMILPAIYSYPWQVTSDWGKFTLKEYIYYGYKYWYPRQIAERDSGLEGYFHRMDLHFPKLVSSNTGTVSFAFTGDLMLVKQMRGKNAEHLYEDVSDFLFEADIKVGNLEYPHLASKSYSSFPRFNGEKDHILRATTWRDQKLDVVFTGNNHTIDMGEEGVYDTIDYLEEHQFAYVGSSKTPEGQDHIPILEKNQIRFAFLSYTFGTNGIAYPDGKTYLTNEVKFNEYEYFDEVGFEQIKKHIALAKAQKVDVVVANFHWGVEHEFYPRQNQLKWAHKVCDEGIDLLLGNHPHIIQPTERYQASDGRQCFIAYSLGNTTGFMNRWYHLNSMLVRLQITKNIDTQQTEIQAVDILPYYFWIQKKQGGKHYRMIDWTNLMELQNNPQHLAHQGVDMSPLHWNHVKWGQEAFFQHILPHSYQEGKSREELISTRIFNFPAQAQ